MPLDHYVSQVHLKNFYSRKLRNLMYVIRKNDLRLFTPNAQSVCRIEDGSTNSYLKKDRAIEEFLKEIEPKYNQALARLAADKIDTECIYTIAGFISYVLVCSPAGMRLSTGPIQASLENFTRDLDSKALLPISPPILGGKKMSELLDSGEIHLKIDHKYPQAIGINSILSHVNLFGNSRWDVLINPFEDNPFFTSDFPVAIEKSNDPHIVNRIVPLAPNLAIRIRPNRLHHRSDLSFSNFCHTVRKLKRTDVLRINRVIVRCAEELVFFRDDLPWIHNFVKKNSQFRIEMKISREKDGFHLEVVEIGCGYSVR